METLQIIPLVMIAVGVVKDFLPKKYISLVAILLGVGFALLLDADVAQITNGVLAGIGSTGAYVAAKGFKSTSTGDVIEALSEKIDSIK